MTCATVRIIKNAEAGSETHVPTSDSRILCARCGWGFEPNERVLSREEMEKLSELAKLPFPDDAPGMDVKEFNNLMFKSKNHEV